MLAQQTENLIDIDKSGGGYLCNESIKDGDTFLVEPSDDMKYLILLPSEYDEEVDNLVYATHDGEVYIPYKFIPDKFYGSTIFWVEELKEGFQLIPNSICVGKASFATSDVFLWKGDVDADGEDVYYSEMDGTELHLSEEGVDYTQPWDRRRGNPYETQSLEEWAILEYGYTQVPLLIQVWFRRYASIETEDRWETWHCCDYGEAPWGCEELLVYKGEVLSQHVRDEINKVYTFPAEFN